LEAILRYVWKRRELVASTNVMFDYD
jgi:hypothetical protein